jgi:electron transport complex protein RnfB
MIPKGRQVFVPCKSFDLGKKVTEVCEIGCIGCKKCLKACNYEAIGFDDNLAWVKWENCTKCLDCVVACPRDLIKVRDMKLYIVEEDELKVGLDLQGRKTIEAKQRKAERMAANQAAEEAAAAQPQKEGQA